MDKIPSPDPIAEKEIQSQAIEVHYMDEPSSEDIPVHPCPICDKESEVIGFGAYNDDLDLFGCPHCGHHWRGSV